VSAFGTLPFLKNVFLVRERQQIALLAFRTFRKNALIFFFHVLGKEKEFLYVKICTYINKLKIFKVLRPGFQRYFSSTDIVLN
jgi:hypothetical protein